MIRNVYGGSEGDYLSSVVATNDGDYIAVGATYSNNGDVSGVHGDSDLEYR